MKNNNSGSALVEYILPTALIALIVGIALYSITTEGSLLKFITNSQNVNSNKNTVTLGSAKSLDSQSEKQYKAGELNGTKDRPVELCNNGSCVIDYGSFILSGVPENFQEFVEAQGSSGGTDKLASLLEQIANQVEQEGDLSSANDIRKLANLGHNMGAVEESIVDLLKTCKPIVSWECICKKQIPCNSTIFDNLPKPKGFDDKYAKFSSENIVVSNGFISNEANIISDILSLSKTPKSPNSNASLFKESLDIIMNNTNLTEEIRGVIKELTWEIGIIGENFIPIIENETQEGIPIYIRDPFNGDEIKNKTYSSMLTHFDSALICASGNNKDSGKKCH